jgi:hypothetical protein
LPIVICSWCTDNIDEFSKLWRGKGLKARTTLRRLKMPDVILHSVEDAQAFLRDNSVELEKGTYSLALSSPKWLRKAPESLVLALVKYGTHATLEAILDQPSISIETLRAVGFRSRWSLGCRIVSHGAVTSEFLGVVFFAVDARCLGVPSELPHVFAALAEHPLTRDDIIARLAQFSLPEVDLALAARPGTAEAILRSLAGSADWRVRSKVAEHPRLPEDLFARLASDPSSEIRKAAARNPAMPPSLLDALSRDAEPVVRLYAGINKATPEECVARLYKDPEIADLLNYERPSPRWILFTLMRLDDVRTRRWRIPWGVGLTAWLLVFVAIGLLLGHPVLVPVIGLSVVMFISVQVGMRRGKDRR